MLDEIFVATFYIRFYMLHQVFIAETIETLITVPMAIACAFGIYLYDFCAYCYFYLFNGIENK